MNITLTSKRAAMLMLASFATNVPFRALVAFDNDTPTLKLAEGRPELREGKLVFTMGDKEELIDPTEVFSLRSRVTALNGEAMNHRKAKETAETALKVFEGLDAEKARKALDIVNKLDQKQLIDAGKVDEVRNEIKNSYEGQLNEAKKRGDTLQERINGMVLSSAFRNSKFTADRLAIPVDIAEAMFGRNFTVDSDGKLSAKDGNGNAIYSKSRPGELADFDEAIETLVNGYANRDAILKGANNNGTGNNGNGGNTGAKNRISRDEFDKLPPAKQAEWANGMRAGSHIVYDAP